MTPRRPARPLVRLALLLSIPLACGATRCGIPDPQPSATAGAVTTAARVFRWITHAEDVQCA